MRRAICAGITITLFAVVMVAADDQREGRGRLQRQIDALGTIDPRIEFCVALRESQDLKGQDSLPAARVVLWFTDFCGSGSFSESSPYY